MANFYTDNPDLKLHLSHPLMEKIVALKERNYSDAEQFDYAPTDFADAMDNYDKVLEIVGDICGGIGAGEHLAHLPVVVQHPRPLGAVAEQRRQICRHGVGRTQMQQQLGDNLAAGDKIRQCHVVHAEHALHHVIGYL